MSKLIAIVAALAATSSLYVTSAGAGCGGGYGFYRSSYRSVARVKDETVAVNTTPVTEKAKVADAKPADATPADAKAMEEVTSAAKDVGCMQFFPSAGLTLSVPCN